MFLVYLPALQGQFLWDDDSWTSKISGLLRDFSGLRLMWCQLTALQQYYPLTGTTFWLDYHLWSFRTLPYHVENLLLHACAALLFWRLLRRLEVAGAWLAGAIFALHPVMVESAAWITERKNVLSLVFYLGALLGYGRFNSFWKEDGAGVPSVNNPRLRWGACWLALLLFLGALLAKTTAFSLPAVILLICWWKRGRLRWRADVLPTLPFFALAIGLCLVTAWLEKNHVGAQGADFAITFPERCLIAGRVPWFYIGKLLWPANLCFVYPRWHVVAASPGQWIYPVAAVGALLVLWFARVRIGRGPAAAAFFFVGTLFPVLGFMNAYFMRYSFVCDHWVYLPSLGLIALVGVAISNGLPDRKSLLAVALVIVTVLGTLSWRHCQIFRNDEALWRDTVTKNPDAWIAHNNLGLVFQDLGQVPEAIAQYEQALRVKPDYAEARSNLGLVLQDAGQVPEAIAQYEQALRLKPDLAEAHYNLGNALRQVGQVAEAVAQYQQALRIKPDYAEPHNSLGLVFQDRGREPEAIGQYAQALRVNPDYFEAHNNWANALLRLGQATEAMAHYEQALRVNPDYFEAQYNLANVLLQAGRAPEAVAHYEQALRLRPDYAETHNNLGYALLRLGRVPEAVAHYEQALRLKPDSAETHYNLGNALVHLGRVSEAIARYREVLRLRPDWPPALSKLAWIFAADRDASIRDGPEAVQLAERLCQVTGNKQTDAWDVLGAAYAETGRFGEAIQVAQKAVESANVSGQADLAGHIQERLKLYQANHPYREGSAPTP